MARRGAGEQERVTHLGEEGEERRVVDGVDAGQARDELQEDEEEQEERRVKVMEKVRWRTAG